MEETCMRCEEAVKCIHMDVGCYCTTCLNSMIIELRGYEARELRVRHAIDDVNKALTRRP